VVVTAVRCEAVRVDVTKLRERGVNEVKCG
jgi:hypothetical protein